MAGFRGIIFDPRVRRFFAFFAGSAAGLAIDLIGFAILVAVGVAPWLSNGISSFASITAVYLLVTRYSFGVGTKATTYIAFVAWYSASIVLFSFLIQTLTSATDLSPYLWKLCSVPFSFALNYLFSLFLFRGRGRGEPAVDDAPEPV